MSSLTMNIYINAWLDCKSPYISIHNRFNDDVLAHFDATEVKQLIEEGDVCYEDFQTINDNVRISLISELITMKSRKTKTNPIKIVSNTLLDKKLFSEQEPPVKQHSIFTSKSQSPKSHLIEYIS